MSSYRMSFTTTITSLFNPAPASMMRLSSGIASGTASDAPFNAATTTTSRKRKRQAPSIQRDYPKRQREAISYTEIDSDDELINSSSDDEDYGEFGIVLWKKPKKTRPLPKHKRFPILSLPRELRDMIYHYCLTDPIGAVYIEERTIRYRRAAVRVCKGPQDFLNNYGYELSHFENEIPKWPTIETYPCDRPQPEPHSATITPALLSVCKQISAEATPFLYSQSLVFQDTCALHGFLSGLTRETRGLLQRITVLGDYHYRSLKQNFDVASLTLLAEGGTNLKSLMFHDPCYRYRLEKDMGKRAARKFYRRAFRWMDAMVRERGLTEATKVPRLFGSECETDRLHWNGRE